MIEENLYYVDEIVRIQNIGGKLFGVIKWQNYNYKETTKQSLQTLKLNDRLRDDCQRLEEKYIMSKYEQKLRKQTQKEIKALKAKIYPEVKQPSKQETIELQPQNESGKKQGRRAKKKELQQERIYFCKYKAREIMRKRLTYGVGHITPEDYFKLRQLHFDARDACQKYRDRSSLIKEEAVREIKAFYPHNGDYMFVISVAGKVLQCPPQKMLEICPIKFCQYLGKTLRYLMGVMENEIKQKEEQIRGRRDKHKPFQRASKVMNIYQRVQAHKYGIHFGLNHQDVVQNIQMQVDYFKGLDRKEMNNQENKDSQSDNGSKSQSKSSSKKRKLALKQSPAQKLRQLYEEIEKEMKKIRRQNSNSRSASLSRSKEQIQSSSKRESSSRRRSKRQPSVISISSSHNMVPDSESELQVSPKRSNTKSKKKINKKSKTTPKNKNKSYPPDEFRPSSSMNYSRNDSSIEESKSSSVLRRSERLRNEKDTVEKKFRRNND